jgi:hypothetical protein
MEDFEQERSLVNVTNTLKKKGYTEDFRITEEGMCTGASDHTYQPEEVTIVDFYRFEGNTNPDDMSILYAIETADGLKGTISNSYGPYADAFVDEFLKKVEDIGKNLDKEHK